MLNRMLILLAALSVVCGPSGMAGECGKDLLPVGRGETGAGLRCPSSDQADAALLKASALLEKAEYGSAADTLRSTPILNCEPRANLLLAAALEGMGNMAEAEETLQRAHSIWPSNSSIATSLAREYFEDGDQASALKALDHFHAAGSMPFQEMEVAVVVFLDSHQLKSAEEVAQTAYKSYPSVQSLLLLANAMQMEGRYKEVIPLLQVKQNVYGKSPQFLITLAESEYDDFLYDAARKDLEDAISLDGHLYQAHLLLGNALLKLGYVDQAIAEYRVAVHLAPNRPHSYYQLALALRSKQDQVGEEQVLIQALAADPTYAAAHSEMGRILMSQNRLSNAVDQLNLSIRYNPSDEEAYYLLTRAYSRLGEKEKSREMAKRLEAVRSANRRLAVAPSSSP